MEKIKDCKITKIDDEKLNTLNNYFCSEHNSNFYSATQPKVCWVISHEAFLKKTQKGMAKNGKNTFKGYIK